MCKILGLWAKWLGYCGVGLMSVRANVPLGVCLVGLILVGRLLLYGEITVRSGYCLSYKCPSGYCLSGMCPWGSACRASVRSSYCADTVSLFGKIASKNQNCLLNLKFEPRLIRKYRTQWWLSCFFLVWKSLFELIWSKNLKLPAVAPLGTYPWFWILRLLALVCNSNVFCSNLKLLLK